MVRKITWCEFPEIFKKRNVVYAIRNNKEKRYYIGQTRNLMRRMLEHFSKGIMTNANLWWDMRKLGVDSFSITILEEIPNQFRLKYVMIDKERLWINRFRKRGYILYNGN